ncbi:putative cytochrome p450 protein [Botrytis fragariae]|uniref:Putative cytochrome p450 protein n=1 Tax=Botrytis fragariae TaxID=1964551 RepID=A0A8H6AYW3_9HELO|nr:putative cytochrome p450 protein [Botrytis fragariae]KAF5875950.1 putative cytochrome p450 protein [Botrytis fragariae]
MSTNSTMESLPDLMSPKLGSLAGFNLLSKESAIVAIGLWVTYLVCGIIYRLYFSPLASIPGPKLAAMTTWYEAYYDIWLGGQYVWKIEKLHKKYGPVIRINPHEIHVSDPDFIDDIYTGTSRKTDKYRFTGRRTQTAMSMVATIPHDIHKRRRGAMSSYFSKSGVRLLEPIIQRSLEKLLARMENASKTGEIMEMIYVFKAATNDIITDYAFGKPSGFMDRDDYNAGFFKDIEKIFLISHTLMHVGWLGPLLESLPRWITTILAPGMAGLYVMQDGWSKQIEDIKSSSDKDAGKNTIFHGLLNSKLPDSEKETPRLVHEAQLTVFAGQDTTASTMAATVFELLANPDKLIKLKKELAIAIPDPNILPSYAQVEHLPYLSAVIQECLRCHPGVITRMARVSPEVPVIYNRNGLKYTMPPGTPMSMTSTIIHYDPKYFPNPRKFEPERWLENPRLDKYLLAFSRGTRNCLGINLAYQEMHTFIAGVFRKYDLYDGTGTQKGPTFELFDTIRERDVDMYADMIVPFPVPGSRGVRIAVRTVHS